MKEKQEETMSAVDEAMMEGCIDQIRALCEEAGIDEPFLENAVAKLVKMAWTHQLPEAVIKKWKLIKPRTLQPIETAPKDGTKIILFDEDSGLVDTGAWIYHGCAIDDYTHKYYAWFSNDGLVENPTHWAPLPTDDDFKRILKDMKESKDAE